MPIKWRTIKSLVHKVRLHGRRGKGMAESFSRQKSRHASQKEGGWEILYDRSPVCPPAGTSNELDVQNKWEENTTQHTTHMGSAPSWLVDDRATLHPRRMRCLLTQQYVQLHTCACCGNLTYQAFRESVPYLLPLACYTLHPSGGHQMAVRERLTW